jgi:hypothetical protein
MSGGIFALPRTRLHGTYDNLLPLQTGFVLITGQTLREETFTVAGVKEIRVFLAPPSPFPFDFQACFNKRSNHCKYVCLFMSVIILLE